MLSGANMFLNAADGLGFSKYCLPTIRKYRSKFYQERNEIPQHKNRVYYIAQQLKVHLSNSTYQDKSLKLHHFHRDNSVACQ